MPAAFEQGLGDALHADRAQKQVIGMAQSLACAGWEMVERRPVVGLRPTAGIIVLRGVKVLVKFVEVRSEIMVEQMLSPVGLVGNESRRIARQVGGQSRVAHRGHPVAQIGGVEGDKNNRSDSWEVGWSDRVGLLPWLEVSAVGHTNSAHGEGVRVFLQIEGNHFTSANRSFDLDGGYS